MKTICLTFLLLALTPLHGVIGGFSLISKQSDPDFDIRIEKKGNLYYVDVTAHSEAYSSYSKKAYSGDYWLITCKEALSEKDLDFNGHYGTEEEIGKGVILRTKLMPQGGYSRFSIENDNYRFILVLDESIIQRTYLIRNLKLGWHDSNMTVVDISSYIESKSEPE